MSRSSKILATIRDDHDSMQEQLTLFAPHKADEQKETNKRESSPKRGSSSATIEKKPGARTKKSASYSAADIQVLEGIAAIRHRPGMYIGSPSPSGLLHLICVALPHHIVPCYPNVHGTQLRWLFGRLIFDDEAYYPLEAIDSRLKAAAYLNGGVTFHLDAWDDAENKQVSRTFYSRDGLPDYVRELSISTSAPLFKQVLGIAKEKDGVQVEVALQPTTGYKTTIYSFANAVRTRDGGVHETGFKAALTKVVHDYALKWGIIKSREKEGFKPEVIQQGLNVVISVKLTNPQFQGQTKDRLNNAPVEGIVRSIVDEGLKDWFEKNPASGNELLKKILQMQKARNEAQLVEELARAGTKKNGELIDTTLSKKFL